MMHMIKMVWGSSNNPDKALGKAEAIKQYEYISDGFVNKSISQYYANEKQRKLDHPSPSSITACRRVIWLDNKDVKHTNVLTWAKQMRLSLGRLLEDNLAKIFMQNKSLLAYMDDNNEQIILKKPVDGVLQELAVEKLQSKQFPGLTGVFDFLLDINGTVVVSDAKTARSDSFGYVPIDEAEVFEDLGWRNRKIQLTGYYILCYENKDLFEKWGLPLPTACHLFSYALDDGVVRREYIWQPTQADVEEFGLYYQNFMLGFNSVEMPVCTCTDFDVKFCKYGIEKKGGIYTSCCADFLDSTN